MSQIKLLKEEKKFLEHAVCDPKFTCSIPPHFHPSVESELNIMRHYKPYLEQETKFAERAKKDENIKIPAWLNYDLCTAVRYESREKLKKFRPETLAQAARISGVNPADIAVLSILIKRGHQ